MQKKKWRHINIFSIHSNHCSGWFSSMGCYKFILRVDRGTRARERIGFFLSMLLRIFIITHSNLEKKTHKKEILCLKWWATLLLSNWCLFIMNDLVNMVPSCGLNFGAGNWVLGSLIASGNILNGVQCFAGPILGFILWSSPFSDLFWRPGWIVCTMSPYLPFEIPGSILVMACLQQPCSVCRNPPSLVTATFFSFMPLAPWLIWVFSTSEWCPLSLCSNCPSWLCSLLCDQSPPCSCYDLLLPCE